MSRTGLFIPGQIINHGKKVHLSVQGMGCESVSHVDRCINSGKNIRSYESSEQSSFEPRRQILVARLPQQSPEVPFTLFDSVINESLGCCFLTLLSSLPDYRCKVICLGT